MSRHQDEMISRMARALRSARRLIEIEREEFLRMSTRAPVHALSDLNRDELYYVRRYDRALKKIDEALE